MYFCYVLTLFVALQRERERYEVASQEKYPKVFTGKTANAAFQVLDSNKIISDYSCYYGYLVF